MIRKWRQNEEGSTAVEFALIGIPFILMVIGIIEMALMFTAQSLLEAATADAAREIRTGAVQQGGGEDAFTESLCDFTAIMIPCDEIQYNVSSMESFSEAEDFPPPTFDENGDMEPQDFDPGGVSAVVMIRTSYKYSIKTPMMQLMLSNNNDGQRIMISTVVLQAEPYEFEND